MLFFFFFKGKSERVGGGEEGEGKERIPGRLPLSTDPHMAGSHNLEIMT